MESFKWNNLIQPQKLYDCVITGVTRPYCSCLNGSKSLQSGIWWKAFPDLLVVLHCSFTGCICSGIITDHMLISITRYPLETNTHLTSSHYICSSASTLQSQCQLICECFFPSNAQYSRLLLKATEWGINFLNWGWVNQTQPMISLRGNSSTQAEVPFYNGNGFLLQGKNDNSSPLTALRGGKLFFISTVNVFYTLLNDRQSSNIS